MANQSYNDYKGNHQSKTNNAERTPVKFMGNIFKESPTQSAVVRFPYHSMDDVTFETTHSVRFPGDKYDRRVRCTGDDCPLCAQGIKRDSRFFVKLIAYETSGSTVTPVAVVWDRPAAFADIDLKNLMAEYGDLTETLFKIKKEGEKLDTRYVIMPIINKTMYPDSSYVKDFSVLDTIDAGRILSRSYEQYEKATEGAQASATQVEASPSKAESVSKVVPEQTKAEVNTNTKNTDFF